MAASRRLAGETKIRFGQNEYFQTGDRGNVALNYVFEASSAKVAAARRRRAAPPQPARIDNESARAAPETR